MRRTAVLRSSLAAAALAALVGTAGAQALPSPKALMDRHNAAIGGRAAIDKHQSIHLSATMNIEAMGGMLAAMELYRARPNKFLQKISLPQFGDVVQGYDGKTVWSTNPMAGAQVLEGDAATALKNQADFYSNLQDSTNYSKAETVELTDFEGKKCYKVHLVRDGRDGTEYFDAETGLIAGISGATPTAQGPIDVTTIIAEYGDYDGVKLPKKIVQRGGPGGATIIFTAVEFDKVDPATFDLPAAVKAMVKP